MALTFDVDITVNPGKILKFNKINAPTSSDGSSYSAGTNEQVLKSNGTTIYWADDNDTTFTVISNDDIDALFT